jgi:hypothetical protein
MIDADRTLILLRQIESLSREGKLVIAGSLIDALYPKPIPEMDLDIVFACKQKVLSWIAQQLGDNDALRSS